MTFSPLLGRLIDALRCLPSVGPRTAQRMAFHLLERKRQEGLQLAQLIQQALNEIQHCQKCRLLSESPICQICSHPRRDASLLCVAETPSDVLALEETGIYHGYYFVLMGHLSPLDGIGPKELGVDLFLERLKDPNLREVILATNKTVEGQTTAHYLADLMQPFSLKISRLAQGIPSGGELEYLDSRTLAEALESRVVMERMEL